MTASLHRLALAAWLTLSVPGALLAQRHEHRHDSDNDDWMEECRDRHHDEDRARFCEERTMGWHAGAGQVLSVDASPNGGVSVSGWDRDSVHVIVRIQAQAGTDDEARELASHVTVSRDGGTLRADGPSSRRYASWSVSYEIYAPQRTDLQLETVNGPIEVENLTGRMQLNAVNGPVSLDHLAGDVRARTENGPMHVELMGTAWEGAGLDAETINGPVVLEVPDGYNAELETGTVNGPVDVGFPVTVEGRIGGSGGRRLHTTLGRGGPRIRAITTNGPAVLRRS
jgi:hypothetical protein